MKLRHSLHEDPVWLIVPTNCACALIETHEYQECVCAYYIYIYIYCTHTYVHCVPLCYVLWYMYWSWAKTSIFKSRWVVLNMLSRSVYEYVVLYMVNYSISRILWRTTHRIDGRKSLQDPPQFLVKTPMFPAKISGFLKRTHWWPLYYLDHSWSNKNSSCCCSPLLVKSCRLPLFDFLTIKRMWPTFTTQPGCWISPWDTRTGSIFGTILDL